MSNDEKERANARLNNRLHTRLERFADHGDPETLAEFRATLTDARFLISTLLDKIEALETELYTMREVSGL